MADLRKMTLFTYYGETDARGGPTGAVVELFRIVHKGAGSPTAEQVAAMHRMVAGQAAQAGAVGTVPEPSRYTRQPMLQAYWPVTAPVPLSTANGERGDGR